MYFLAWVTQKITSFRGMKRRKGSPVGVIRVKIHWSVSGRGWTQYFSKATLFHVGVLKVQRRGKVGLECGRLILGKKPSEIHSYIWNFITFFVSVIKAIDQLIPKYVQYTHCVKMYKNVLAVKRVVLVTLNIFYPEFNCSWRDITLHSTDSTQNLRVR